MTQRNRAAPVPRPVRRRRPERQHAAAADDDRADAGAVLPERPVRPRAGRRASPAGCWRRPDDATRLDRAVPRSRFGRPPTANETATSRPRSSTRYAAGAGRRARPRSGRGRVGRARPRAARAATSSCTWIDRCHAPLDCSRRAVRPLGRGRLAADARHPQRAARGRRAPTRSPRSRRTSRAKAKAVIFLFMTGGVSHVDTFDPKPKLIADHGKTGHARPPGDAQPARLREAVPQEAATGSSPRAASAASRSATCSRTSRELRRRHRA